MSGGAEAAHGHLWVGVTVHEPVVQGSQGERVEEFVIRYKYSLRSRNAIIVICLLLICRTPGNGEEKI